MTRIAFTCYARTAGKVKRDLFNLAEEYVIQMLYELRDMIARSGRVEEIYGGYEITITDTNTFPGTR